MLDLREKMAIENEKLSYENALLTEDIENNEFVIRKLNENEDSLKKTNLLDEELKTVQDKLHSEKNRVVVVMEEFKNTQGLYKNVQVVHFIIFIIHKNFN